MLHSSMVEAKVFPGTWLVVATNSEAEQFLVIHSTNGFPLYFMLCFHFFACTPATLSNSFGVIHSSWYLIHIPADFPTLFNLLGRNIYSRFSTTVYL